MSLDISRFYETFFEESLEGLTTMEAGLLQLAAAVGTAPNADTINDVFRAAHSIKGGSGIFGFGELTDFTHFVETLLDDLRCGRRAVTSQNSQLLLQSVDCLRSMIEARRDATAVDQARVAAITQQLREALDAPASEVAPVAAAVGKQPGVRMWRIRFQPYAHLFQTGNDPLRLLKELRELGDCQIVADGQALPGLSAMDPETCYLAWDIALQGNVAEEQIRAVFDWVEEDCELTITATAVAESQMAAIEPAVDRQPVVEMKPVSRGGESSSLRVSTEKVDAIINLVGELVITQSMLSRFGDVFEMHMVDQLRDGLALLARNTRELQETVLKIRMLPISFCFNRFPRLVHDLSSKLGKHIQLKVTGEQTELDKTVLEKITDPLVHLVRNSLDHGIESPGERCAAGKPETGTIHLEASHEGGSVVIRISDDGRGLDTQRILAKARERGLVGADQSLSEEEIYELIFAPGFSTASQVTDLSGRGVGMDVVRRNIKELGGRIETSSRPGAGTSFTIRLPLTLAILDGQLVQVAGETYVVPLISIVESLQIRKQFVNTIANGAEVYRLREEYIPIVRLYEVFQLEPVVTSLEAGLLMVIEADGRKAGIFVDDLLAQQQVVIKSLESNYRKVEGISGATILGDGTVALILDIPGILRLSQRAAAA